MASPTVTTGAGFSVVAVAASLGLDPAAIFWSFVGASLGMSFAPPSGRLRAAVVFVCATLVSSLFGISLAAYLHTDGHVAQNVYSCVFSIFLHPLILAVVNAAPQVVQGVLKKIGLGSS